MFNTEEIAKVLDTYWSFVDSVTTNNKITLRAKMSSAAILWKKKEEKNCMKNIYVTKTAVVKWSKLFKIIQSGTYVIYVLEGLVIYV